MAKLTQTSRPQLDRLLGLNNQPITLLKVALVIGEKLHIFLNSA